MLASTSTRAGARSKPLVGSHTNALYVVDSTIQHSNATRERALLPQLGSKQQRNSRQPLPSSRQLLSLGLSPINRGVLKELLKLYPNLRSGQPFTSGRLIGLKARTWTYIRCSWGYRYSWQSFASLGSSARTMDTYETAMKSFDNFRRIHELSEHLPVNRKEIYLFIAHLSTQGYAVFTATTYLSVIAYFHKIRDMPDPTIGFIVKEMMEGYKRKNGVNKDKRRLASLELLIKILTLLQSICKSSYECSLFRTAFALAFLGFSE